MLGLIKTKVNIDGLCTHLGQDLNKIRNRTGERVWFARVSMKNDEFSTSVEIYTEQGTLGHFLFSDPPDGYIHIRNTPSAIDPDGKIFEKILEILYERPNYTKISEGTILRYDGSTSNILSEFSDESTLDGGTNPASNRRSTSRRQSRKRVAE